MDKGFLKIRGNFWVVFNKFQGFSLKKLSNYTKILKPDNKTVIIMKKSLVISIDFDGTCVAHDFPRVGADIGAVPILKRIVKNGHRLLLNTMRSYNEDGIADTITPALNWFSNNNIPIWSVNENPEQWRWTNSNKIFANYYIDDTSIGIPLLMIPDLSRRPFVDWERVEKILEEKGII